MNSPLPRSGENNLWYLDLDTDSVIVFVHGIFSDSRSCWLREKPYNLLEKPMTYWPDLIATDQRFDRYSIFMGGYYTAFDAGPYDVANCAHELFAAMGRKINGQRSVLERKNIIFVCHSTGGIVVRYMLDTEFPQFEEHPLGLLLIASPSYGSKWSTRLGLLSRFYNQQLGKRLEWGNWSLEDLDDRFKRLLAERRLPGLIGQEAYENHFIFHRRWLPDRSLLVPKESAGKYFGPPIQLWNTDHFTAVKPGNRQHPAYVLLSDFVARSEREQDDLRQKIAAVGSIGPEEPDSIKPAKRKKSGPRKLKGLAVEVLEATPGAAPLSVNEMVSAEEKAETRRRWKLFGAGLIVFSISLYVGRIFGQLYAFDFTSRDSDFPYLATHSQWRRLDDKRGELSAVAGVRRFHFSTDDRAVAVEYLPVSYASLSKRSIFDVVQDQDKLDALAAPVFIAETGKWVGVFNTAGRITGTEERFLLMASLATGGAIGFLWGARDRGNADLPEFQYRLQSDTELWKSQEEQLRKICRAIRIRFDVEEADEALKEMGESLPAPPRLFHGKVDNFHGWVQGFYSVHPEMVSCEAHLPPAASDGTTNPVATPK